MQSMNFDLFDILDYSEMYCYWVSAWQWSEFLYAFPVCCDIWWHYLHTRSVMNVNG